MELKKSFRQMLEPGNSLSQRVVRGGLWMFGLRITRQLFSLVRVIILARLLAPHDFGLLGVALLTIGILETFSQTGFQEALIQKKENVQSYLDSAWTFLVLRGVILFTILYLVAPYAAVFFEASLAESIIRIIGLSVLFNAFTNIGIVYFQKELEFNKRFFYQLSGMIADFIVAVSAALILRNVWALAFGLLAGSLVSLIVSYFIHPYRPRFDFQFEKSKELFSYGKWLFLTSILVFFLLQGDDIFVGKILGVTALGFYQMAYRISNLPATEITNVFHEIVFPAFSKLQDNEENLKKGYLEILQTTAFISIPIAVGIILLAPEFVKIFLGEKWMPIVLSVQILAIFGMIRSIGSITTGSLLRGVGKPKIETKIQIARLMLLIVLIYPLTKVLGFAGTALAVLLSAVIIQPFVDYLGIKISKCGLKAYLETIGIPLLSSLSMALIVLAIKTFFLFQINILNFILLMISGILAYGLIIYLFDRYYCKYRFRDLILKRIFLSLPRG